MDIASPEIRWTLACHSWKDTGDTSDITTLIREGVPIPESMRGKVADALEGKPRGVSPNHKTSKYSHYYQLRASLSIKVKSEFKELKKKVKSGKVSSEQLPWPAQQYVTKTKGYGINKAVADALNNAEECSTSAWWVNQIEMMKCLGLHISEDSVSRAAEQLSPETSLINKRKK